MPVHTSSPELDNAIVNPEFWGDEQGIHEQLAWLRKNDALRFVQPEGFDPFWCVTRYDHIKEIEGNKAVFINAPRSTLGPKGLAEMVEAMTGRKNLVHSLVQMDEPLHMKYRMLTQGWFMGANLKKLQTMVDAHAVTYVDRLATMNGECDFVKDVAIWYPLRVIMSILGVPEDDEALMLKLTQELFGSTDPDNQRSFEPNDFLQVVYDFEAYFNRLTQARRDNPTGDVASLIANAEVDGAPLPELDANGYYIIIATAGHDTTSASIAGGLQALLQNPSELEKFKADPEAIMATAMDEMIRWVTPVRHFMRTAVQDYELDGKTIKAGESVILWYPSANRDEAVFNKPFDFRIDRSDAKQLAFGFGAHVCLGQHLARMEMAALFRELFKRVEHIELAGDPKYVQSTFVGGLKSLPIRYRMK